MPNYIRPKVRGTTIFFTVALADRGSDLLVRHVDWIRAAVRITRAERPFEIEAMVVLPDHLHAVLTLPLGDADFSTRWGAIKGRFSQGLGRAGFTPPVLGGGGVNPALRRKGEVGLWQRRFWEHHIRGVEDLADHLAYCWQDPVRHGLVARAEDWLFSSIHREMREGRVEAGWSGGEQVGRYGERRGMGRWKAGRAPPYAGNLYQDLGEVAGV